MKKIFLFLLLCTSIQSFAQNEASYWYFGQNAGLRFDLASGDVTALTDGQINTLEGCTSISDTNGNLLFYSDGITVWNRNHQVMQNGFGLKGDPSSTSSGVIVPKPQDPTQYYLFTVDEPHHFNSSQFPTQTDGDGINDGLMYSLIDMDLDNGLGGVVEDEKNRPLVTYDETDPLEVEFKCAEKITAVKADDCFSFWVITHFINRFYAFKVDLDGVNEDPVVSTLGPEVPIDGYRRNALGYIKASPDGTKLVLAHFGFATIAGGDAPGGVYLYDFDNDTGIVSNSVELFGPQNNTSPYGVEFSAENKKVYATVGVGAGGNGTSQLLQWDLEATDIPGSLNLIHTSNNLSAGALQLGLDKRIYRAQVDFGNFNNTGKHLGVINNPELAGQDASYDEFGILVDVNNNSQHLSRIGLPPFIQSLFNTEIDIIQNGISTTQLLLCDGADYTLMANEIQGADYTWFKDGIELIGETLSQLFVEEPGFYEVFIEPNNGECPIEGSAVVEYFEIPVIAMQPEDIRACDTQTEFDLTLKDSEILGSLDADTYIVKYFDNISDFNVNQNEISGLFTTTEDTQTIFVRVENIGNGACFDETSFNIIRFETPDLFQIDPKEVCDTDANGFDAITTLDLEALANDLLSALDLTIFNYSFHSSFEDAEDNLSPLGSIYVNSDPTEDVFIRVYNQAETDCFEITSFQVTVNTIPLVNDITIIQCDEDGIPEGFTLFNLNNHIDDITDNAQNKTVTFYLDFEDAENTENEINSDNFNNFFNPQTIYAHIIDNVTGCSNIAEVTLEISTTSTSNASIQLCDTDGLEDGFMLFNLLDAQQEILNGISTTLDVVFYETYENALLENNPLEESFTNTVAYNQTVYARVENMNDCFGISEVELTVFELPNVETTFETIYCLNEFPDTITLTGGVIGDDPSNYYYEWNTGADESEIQINDIGTYTVVVSNTDGCSKTRTITVLPSNIATLEDILVTDTSSNNTITIIVAGEGDYEYAIDNPNGPYQDSNVFENVSFGFHDVFVRDKNGCGISTELVSVIGFPKFFTPNGDNYNPFWQVKGISTQFQANSTILIYDRHGKLLASLDPLGSGWDGTFNGNPMPSSDYWFSVTLEDGRNFNGHFALKR